MAIEVLIKRDTGQNISAKTLLPHIIELRAHAVKQPGYISGETLFNLNRAEECLVISRWTKLEYWERWLKNPVRIELNSKIERQLGATTEYNIYSVSLW